MALLRSSSLFRFSKQLACSRFYSSDYAAKFDAAQQNVKKLKEAPGNDVKLQLYALFKQATTGDVTGKQPSMINFVERAKYDAWAGFKGLSNSDAQKKYVELAESLIAEEKTDGAQESSGSSQTGSIDGLKITIADNVCRIELNRPKKYNALTLEMYDGIVEALKEADANKAVKFVVFAGTGEYYCSGNDLKNFEKAATMGKEKFAEEARQVFHRFVNAFINFNKPIIGLVNGPAVGISVTLLPLFNMVWASDTATFHTPFVTLGQSIEGTSSYTFPALMGHLKASEFLLFGRKLTAPEAYERNLVNEVIPQTTFFEECNRRIAKYAKLPPEALKVNKNVLRDVHRENLLKVNTHEATILKERWLSKECEQALIEFMTRRTK